MPDIMSEYVSDRKSVGGDHWKKISVLHDARILNHNCLDMMCAYYIGESYYCMTFGIVLSIISKS